MSSLETMYQVDLREFEPTKDAGPTECKFCGEHVFNVKLDPEASLKTGAPQPMYLLECSNCDEGALGVVATSEG